LVFPFRLVPYHFLAAKVIRRFSALQGQASCFRRKIPIPKAAIFVTPFTIRLSTFAIGKRKNTAQTYNKTP